MKKATWNNLKHIGTTVLAAVMIVGLIFTGVDIGMRRVTYAQAQGYRFSQNGLILQGPNASICFESVFGFGADSCLTRLQPGNMGFTLGGVNSNWSTLPPTPIAAASASSSGGTLATGTYIFANTYLTITGGETTIVAAQESTNTTVTGPTASVTLTAPIAAAGAAGWRPYATTSTTLTELSLAVNATVCAGAFQVNGPLGAGTGPWVCPFGTNAVITTLTAAPTVTTPNIPGSGPTVQNGGMAIPAQNTAAYPAAIPQVLCSSFALTAITTSTTIKTIASCPLIAGAQNFYGKALHVTGHGVYTATGTPTFAVSLVEGGVTPIIITSAAVTTGGQTNAQFSFDLYVTTGLTGTAGKVEAHGTLTLQGATAANTTAMIVYEDTNTALSSALDLTAANTLTIGITGSSGVSATTLRDSQIVLMN